MRGILIMFTLCVLGGCAVGPSLDELEAQALVTGDWSLVERREAQIARRQQRGPSCPPGSVAYCETFMADKRCSCVSQSAFYSLINIR